MLLDEAIDILEEYVVIDRETRETQDYSNDFDKFCEEKCIAIETLIDFVIKEVMKEETPNERRANDQ